MVVIADYKRVVIIGVAGEGGVLIGRIEIFCVEFVVLLRRVDFVVHEVVLLERVGEIDGTVGDSEAPVAEEVLLAPDEH